MLQKNKKTIGKIILISIFILALLLRIWGINFGLKDNKGMSDEGGITRNAHRVSVGELRPTQYIYPASTLIYGVGTLYIPIHFLYNLITSSKADLHKQGIINYGWFYFVGRFIVALIGSFTVLILYKIGKTIFNKKVGYSAALFLAVCPLHVRLSHYFTVDVTLTFFLLLVILYSYTHIYKKDNLKSALLPGIFLGLCVATKYTGIIGIVPIISAHILKIIQEQNKNIFYKFKKIIFSKRLWLIFLISIIVFSLVSPYFWFDISKAINNVTREAKNNHSNHGGLGFLCNMKYYLLTSLGFHVTGILAFLSWIGFVYLFFQKKKSSLIIAFSLLGFIIVTSIHPLHWDRWMVIATPLIALCASLLIIELYKLLKKTITKIKSVHFLKFIPKIILFFIIIILATPAFLQSVRTNLQYYCYEGVSRPYTDRRYFATNNMLKDLHCEPERKRIKPVYFPIDDKSNKDKLLWWLGFRSKFYQ